MPKNIKLTSLLFGKKGSELIEVTSPLKGKVIDIATVNDLVFSREMLGRGLAIIPSEGNLYAPENGYVKALYPTNHAIGLVFDNGIEMLVHIGIDTVKLDGVGFTSNLTANERFNKGDILIEFDTGFILGKGYDLATSVIVTNDNKYKTIEVQHVDQTVDTDSVILNVYK